MATTPKKPKLSPEEKAQLRLKREITARKNFGLAPFSGMETAAQIQKRISAVDVKALEKTLPASALHDLRNKTLFGTTPITDYIADYATAVAELNRQAGELLVKKLGLK